MSKEEVMKSNHTQINRQCGFFDLGFSLAVLAIGGVLAAAVVPSEPIQAQQQMSGSVVENESSKLPKDDCGEG